MAPDQNNEKENASKAADLKRKHERAVGLPEGAVD
jgi:hypothetical protein